jgi:hypothetical protein
MSVPPQLFVRSSRRNNKEHKSVVPPPIVPPGGTIFLHRSSWRSDLFFHSSRRNESFIQDYAFPTLPGVTWTFMNTRAAAGSASVRLTLSCWVPARPLPLPAPRRGVGEPSCERGRGLLASCVGTRRQLALAESGSGTHSFECLARPHWLCLHPPPWACCSASGRGSVRTASSLVGQRELCCRPRCGVVWRFLPLCLTCGSQICRLGVTGARLGLPASCSGAHSFEWPRDLAECAPPGALDQLHCGRTRFGRGRNIAGVPAFTAAARAAERYGGVFPVLLTCGRGSAVAGNSTLAPAFLGQARARSPATAATPLALTCGCAG